MATQAVYYRDEDGAEPVLEFIDRVFPLEPPGKNPSQAAILKRAKRRAEVDLQIDRLNGLPDRAPPLAFPHSSQIEGELRELRFKVGGQELSSPLPPLRQPVHSSARS